MFFPVALDFATAKYCSANFWQHFSNLAVLKEIVQFMTLEVSQKKSCNKVTKKTSGLSTWNSISAN